MSFATDVDVMDCVETLIRRLWKEVLEVELPVPFPRMTYLDAMSMYGSDKPDPRLEMTISRIEDLLPKELISKLSPLENPIVEAIVFPASVAFGSNAGSTRKFIKEFLDSPEAAPFHSNPCGGPGVFIRDPAQPLQGLQAFGFQAAEDIASVLPSRYGDLLILQARSGAVLTGNSTPLGNIRLALHNAAVKSSCLPPLSGFAPLWITEFPLFTPISSPPDGHIQTLISTHHPFTSPRGPKDIDVLATEPRLAVAAHYDLVMNGIELGGGSRRIHHAGLQSYVLRDVLKLPAERLAEFSHLIEVLRAGCPPHAGIALGFDRLIAVLLGRTSVRDVIAFPKSGRGEDPLVKSPGRMSDEILETYHLKLKE